MSNRFSSRFTSRFVIKDGYGVKQNHKVSPLLFFDGEVVSSAFIFVYDSHYYKNAALSTKRDVLYAIGLFYEFCCNEKVVIDNIVVMRFMLNKFYDTLIRGTLGIEDTELLWSARNVVDANKIIVYVKRYIEYSLRDLTVINIYGSKQENDKVYGAVAEYSMLSHLESQKKNMDALRKSVNYQGINLDFINKERANYSAAINEGFPKEKAFELITKGCLISKNEKIKFKNRFNARNALLFCMYLFGGLRKSEPLHLFIDDLEIGDDQLNVQLAHPVRAPIIYNGDKKTREEYLWDCFKLKPRTQLSKTEHAGWKNLEELDKHTMSTNVIWVAPNEIKLLIMQLHQLYIEKRYEWIKKSDYKHPYYFVDENGGPLKVIAVDRAWRQACKRINLTGSRKDSENIHGARHMIGKMLKDLGFAPNVIKTVLHHKNIHSQIQYQRIGIKDAQRTINDAFIECNAGRMNGEKISLDYCWPKTDKNLIVTGINEIAELFEL